MLDTLATVLVLLITAFSLFSGVASLFSNGTRVHAHHLGVADALELARGSRDVRLALGDDWQTEKCWVSLNSEEILEHTICGTARLVGSKNRGKLDFDYKRIGSTRSYLRVKVKVGKETIELAQG